MFNTAIEDYQYRVAVYLRAICFVSTGGLVISRVKIGPLCALILLLSNCVLVANPLKPGQKDLEKAQTWTLFLKQVAAMAGCLLIMTRGKIVSSDSQIRLISDAGSQQSRNVQHRRVAHQKLY